MQKNFCILLLWTLFSLIIQKFFCTLDAGARPNIVDKWYRFWTCNRFYTEHSSKNRQRISLQLRLIIILILGDWRRKKVQIFIAGVFRIQDIRLSLNFMQTLKLYWDKFCWLFCFYHFVEGFFSWCFPLYENKWFFCKHHFKGGTTTWI